jgi:hypothetical protein
MHRSQTFDLVFIDGLHEADQVLRDVNHALTVLNDDGTIVCHDLNPRSYQRQVVPRLKASGAWLGDCWKAWVSLRRRANLSMFVVDTDYGCGIIRRRHPKSSIGPFSLPLTSAPLVPDFKGLQSHRVEWLNLIPLTTFKEWLADLNKSNPSDSLDKYDCVDGSLSLKSKPSGPSNPTPLEEPVSTDAVVSHVKTSKDIIEMAALKDSSLEPQVNEEQAKVQPRVPTIPTTRRTRKKRGK